MKKRSLLLILLCICIILPSKVFAFTATLHFNGSVETNNIWYTSTHSSTLKAYRGSMHGSGSSGYYIYKYVSGSYSIIYNGKTYGAVCIDPGLLSPGEKVASSTTDVTVKCEPKTSTAMSYIMDKYSSQMTKTDYDGHVKVELAMRALANKAGLMSTYAIEYDRFPGGAIYNSVALKKKNGDILLEKATTDYTDLRFSDRNGSTIVSAQDLYSESLSDGRSVGGGTADGADESSDLYFYGGGPVKTGNTYTYTVLAKKKNIKQIKAECENNSCSNVTYTWDQDAKKGTITLEDSDCKYKLRVYYENEDGEESDDDESHLYMCYYSTASSKNHVQKYMTYLSDKGENSIPEPFNGEIDDNHEDECDECTCDGDELTPESSIYLCCVDSKNSYVYEPDISSLFCDKEDTGLKVLNYVMKDCIKTSSYVIPKSESTISSNYCKLICTEKIDLLVPDIVTGKNGKYFRIPSVSDDSDGPLITGHKTCRLLTAYNEWQDDYLEATESAVSDFNNYQEKKAIADMYTNTYNSKIKDASYKTDRSENRTVNYSSSETYTCGDGSKKTVTFSASVNESCTVKYKYYLSTGDYSSVTFNKAKVSYSGGEEINNFYGLKIVANGTGSTSTSDALTGYYDGDWDSTSCGHSSSDTYSSCTATFACPGDESESSHTHSCKYSSVGSETITDVKSDFDKYKSNGTTNGSEKYSSYKSAYNTDVTNINNLEDDLLECDNYFETGYGTQKNSDGSYKLYEVTPTVAFNYFQVAVDNSDSSVGELDRDVNYKVTCTYGFHSVYSGGLDDTASDYGLEDSHYNEYNSHQNATINNFDNASIPCLNNSGISDCSNTNVVSANILSGDKDYSQRYTSDAYYSARCTSKDEGNSSYVVYPYGSLEIDSTSTVTTRSTGDWVTWEDGAKSYYYTNTFIEYSALTGAFQTQWTFTGLGTSGKFDSNFGKGKDCSGDSVNNGSSATTYCVLKIFSNLTKIGGCPPKSTVVTNNTSGSTYWKHSCCESGCEFKDILTYAFKIVDSDDLFPDDGLQGTDDAYGYNWLVSEKGKAAKSEIETRGSKDNVYDTDNVSYQFTLTTADMEVIKKYNDYESEHSDGYADFKLDCQVVVDENGYADSFYNCKSEFLTNFYDGTVKSGSTTFGTLSTSLGSSKLNKLRDVSTSTHAHRHVETIS